MEVDTMSYWINIFLPAMIISSLYFLYWTMAWPEFVLDAVMFRLEKSPRNFVESCIIWIYGIVFVFTVPLIVQLIRQ